MAKERTADEIEANERRWRLRAEKLHEEVEFLRDCNARQEATIKAYQAKKSKWWFERRRLQRLAGEPEEDAA